MTDLLGSVQVILNTARFRTRLTSVLNAPAVSFENDSVMGFVVEFATAEDLLAGWCESELAFLRAYAPRLRESGDKAWNVYSVFLSTQAASDDVKRSVRWVEENLERTRKITSAGPVSRGELLQVLLPILPLQHQAVLAPGDVEARLRSRLELLWPKAADAILSPAVEPVEILQLLRRS